MQWGGNKDGLERPGAGFTQLSRSYLGSGEEGREASMSLISQGKDRRGEVES